MTHYQGGKKRLGKEISEIIYNISTEYEMKCGLQFKGYCEPFCGMLGVYQHIPKLFEDRKPSFKFLAGDRNEDLINMWNAVQKGWKPPSSCSKQEYYRLKRSPSSPKREFIAYAGSFRGVYYGGYDKRNIKKQQQNVLDAINSLKSVKFKHGTYDQFSTLKNFIIYCDPPYQGTRHNYVNNRKFQRDFESNKFFNWCEKMSKNNLVFVSEYNAPKDFKLIWKKGKEKLFLV